MPERKCWVVTQGGYDWDEVVAVYTDEAKANAKHAELTKDLKKRREVSLGYGAGVQESVLIED